MSLIETTEKYFINEKFNRLGLHDSSVTSFYKENGKFVVEFDWAYLENYSENGINEGIILGKTKMEIFQYSNGIFKLDYSGSTNYKFMKSEYIECSEAFKNWDVIMENSYDTINKKFKISGLYEKSIICWIEWTFNFESIILSWTNHILHKDWLNGVIIE